MQETVTRTWRARTGTSRVMAGGRKLGVAWTQLITDVTAWWSLDGTVPRGAHMPDRPCDTHWLRCAHCKPYERRDTGRSTKDSTVALATSATTPTERDDVTPPIRHGDVLSAPRWTLEHARAQGLSNMRQRDSPNRASARGETATPVHVAVVVWPSLPRLPGLQLTPIVTVTN